jgi:tripartite-type tricarboxylate transporter receptor subunit TctC
MQYSFDVHQASSHLKATVIPFQLLRRFFTITSCVLWSAVAQAQSTYPDRPIKLIVPAAAGGPTDILARFVADSLSKSLGQPSIIENRAGAGGTIGARAVASAEPNGYTLLFGNTATLATIPATSKSAGYDPRTSFAAVAKVIDSYQIVVVNSSLPIKSIAELITYAKANAGKMNFGAVGLGNLTHLSGELLKARTGIQFETAQYKSGAESLQAVLAGQVDFAIDNIGAIRPFAKEGRLRALAVTSATRESEFPELPTMAEAGVNDFVVTSFFGVVAPIGTPPSTISRLNAAINDGFKVSAFQASLRQIGAKAAPDTPEHFHTLIDQETRKWMDIAHASNIDINN